MIGFERADGCHYCYHDGDVKYKDICIVKLSGKIIWSMDCKKIPLEEYEKIICDSKMRKENLNRSKEKFKTLKANIKCVAKGSMEYFILLHNIAWYRNEIRIIENI